MVCHQGLGEHTEGLSYRRQNDNQNHRADKDHPGMVEIQVFFDLGVFWVIIGQNNVSEIVQPFEIRVVFRGTMSMPRT